MINIRLRGFGKLNGLSVAAAFEVEYPVVIPAVFIIANQAAFRIGREGGLAGTGKAEEDSDILFFPDVGGAVHGSDALQRQQVVHDREHPFFHFAAVPGSADKLDALGQIERDEVFGVQTLFFPLRVGALSAVHHDEIRLEVRQLFIAWANKHVLHEMRLPGDFGNKADAQAGVGVGAAEGVNDKQALAGELAGHQPLQVLPRFLRKRLVVVLTFAFIGPPHGIAGGVVTNDILIFWRTAGKNTGIYGDCTKIC